MYPHGYNASFIRYKRVILLRSFIVCEANNKVLPQAGSYCASHSVIRFASFNANKITLNP